ncbi:MAG: polysaccharide deacetylase family protein [Candidatus Hydrogenedentes bacterium]|nr:polysaccharide deacetylase family protein [Candidatus Hydrogenedentota bacterium]
MLWTAGAVAQEAAPALAPAPDKTVVLTFDDAVKSHRTFVGPLLKELGFSASFFVTQLWMEDKENFMTWQDIAELHQMGFEIGNHTWTHLGLSTAERAKQLPEELRQVEAALAQVGVPKPISFAWPGNAFSAEARDVLKQAGYRFARRGMQPEVPYGKIIPGPPYEPAKYDPLLVPSTGDAYPEWTLEHFKQVVAQAVGGKIVVVQFHGVPDIAHPWVHTPPERFQEYMRYLKDEGFQVLALRDLARYVDPDRATEDPHLGTSYSRK